MNPVIEAFRGAAALLVMLHHFSYELPPEGHGAGWSLLHFFHNGVDLFFVITGFLFAPCVLRHAHMPLRSFLVRRAFRLYPLYAVSLVIVAASSSDRPGVLQQLGRHLLFIQALPVFPLADAGYFSLVYWTLPVEVAFYVLVALALWRGNFGASDPAKTTRLLAGWGIASLAGFLASFHGAGPVGAPEWIQWQGQLPALLIEFWFGLALYAVFPWLGRQRKFAWLALGCGVALLGALMATYAGVAQGSRAPRPFGVFNVLSALGYALMLGGCLGLSASRGERRAGWLARACVEAGGLSYGMYLFHGIALSASMQFAPTLPAFARLAVAVLLTLVFAATMHAWVEEPMRALGRRLSAAGEETGDAAPRRRAG